MHPFLHFLAASTTSTTTKHSKSSGSQWTFLIIIGLFAVVYLFFIRPRSQRARQQRATGNQISVGDEVMSAGGIYGRVVAVDSDVVEVEVSPGVVMSFTRRAISPRQGAARGPAQTSAGAAAGPANDEWDTPPALRDHPVEPDGPEAADGRRPEGSDDQRPEDDDASGPESGAKN
jgi:preprotein translocase subunit YajC